MKYELKKRQRHAGVSHCVGDNASEKRYSLDVILYPLTNKPEPTMTIPFSSICAVVLASFSVSAFAQDRGQSDILGTWTWTMPKTKCAITRTYRGDGTSQVTNGQKKTEGKFSVRTDHTSGMQMVIYTVSKDGGGGANCDGESDDTTGKRYLAYFETKGSELTMCVGPEKAACVYGPYRRQ